MEMEPALLSAGMHALQLSMKELSSERYSTWSREANANAWRSTRGAWDVGGVWVEHDNAILAHQLRQVAVLWSHHG